MSIRSSLSTGFSRMARTPRLILFAWTLNVLLAMIIALPVYGMLDDALRGSMYEQPLMERMDHNWWLTFKEDHADNPYAGLLDLTVMGAAPFLSHLDALLHGGIVLPLTSLFRDLVWHWNIPDPMLGILAFVGLLGMLVQVVLSAGFISAYRGDYPPTISEFLSDGVRHFGPFIRLSVLVFLLQTIILYPVVQSLSSWVASGTQNSASEMIPLLLYMARNLLAFVLFFLVSISADYARVHLILQRRVGAVFGLWDGFRFMISHVRVTWGVSMLLLLVTTVIMASYGALEFLLPKDSILGVLLLFGLHQTYMIGRSAIRALTYATEVDVFQTSGIRS